MPSKADSIIQRRRNGFIPFAPLAIAVVVCIGCLLLMVATMIHYA